MRRSPSPRSTDHALRGRTVGSNFTSSAGSAAFLASAFLPANQPFMVLQPASSETRTATAAMRLIMSVRSMSDRAYRLRQVATGFLQLQFHAPARRGLHVQRGQRAVVLGTRLLLLAGRHEGVATQLQRRG